jgi:DNA-directed RNA polymerase subunit omega
VSWGDFSGRGADFTPFWQYFGIANAAFAAIVPRSLNNGQTKMNAELQKKALEKVGNPNTLINLVSRRVRQLNAGSGGISRPLIADAGTLGAGDIALREIIEEKIGWDPAEDPAAEAAPKKRKAKR